MSKLTIYASDIKPFKSVIGVFNGSEDFAIENPWFPIPGAKPCDPKSYMGTIPDSKGGLFLNAPRLLRKTPTGTFTPFYAIGWTTVVQNQKLRKDYRIHAPYGGQPLKRKQKLMVSPGNRELADDDNKLLLFNWQLTMIEDVLLVARILDVNLARYKDMDNTKFYNAFIKDVNEKLKARKADTLMVVDEELVNAWMNPPIVSKNKRKEEIFINDINKPQEMAFQSLMQAFYESITSIGDATNFNGKFLERIWDKPNCFAVPTFRLKTFIRKDDPERNAILSLDTRLIVYAKVDDPKDPDFKAKIPDSLCTSRQISKTKKVKITKQTMPELWGETEYHTNPEKHESATYSGCIFIAPTLSFSFHEKGCPTIDWRIDTLAINKTVRAEMDELEDACDFMEDPTSEQQAGGTTNEEGEFMNEAEHDPDSLI